MFARFFVLSLALLASASHLEARQQCNTAQISCCNQVQSVQQAGGLLQKLGLAAIAASVGAGVGLTCTPISVIGTGKGCQAQEQPVCCEHNNYNGLVNLGCSPVNLSL